jgi:lipoprotein-releasing system permease protein
LNTGLFIAKRLVNSSKGNFSWTFVVIAVISIALGVAIMFTSIAILTGFKKEIREKVVAFSGHVQITRFTENANFEPQPVDRRQPFLPELKRNPDVKQVQVYATKAGIIKTGDQIQGVVLKGVGADFDWSFFKKRMAEGSTFRVTDGTRSDDVIISRKLADIMDLKCGDNLRMYFISGNSTLGRKFRITGLFDTGLEEFDKLYVIGDIYHLQKLNNWTADQVGGFEVFLKDFDDTDRMGEFIYHLIGFSLDASTIRMIYPQIFDWLELQDVNVLIILILIVMVSATTIVSTLLILILERTAMIGMLKAFGMRNQSIRKIFLYYAIYIVALGMFWGNAIALALCILQKKTGWVKLSEESYYVSVVPVNFDMWNILLLNAGTLVVCFAIFLIPSYLVTRVSPVRAIRFN